MPTLDVAAIVDSRDCSAPLCDRETTGGSDLCAFHERWLRQPQGGNVPEKSEVTDLINHIRKTGHKVTKTGNSKHWKVLRPNGAVVVDKSGPIILSSSPSVNRWREMAVQRLMADDIPGGPVLKVDPYKPTKSAPANKQVEKPERKGGPGQITAEMRAKSLAATQAKSKAYEERTGKLRARWEPILAKLGGWQRVQGGSGISRADFGRVMTTWARNRGRVELPKKTQRGTPMNDGALNQIISMFAKGSTLGDYWMPLFEIFIDALERESGTPPDPAKSAAKYREYEREAKGISPGPQSPAAGPPVIPAEPKPAPPVVDEPETEVRIERPDGEVRIVPLTPPAEPIQVIRQGETAELREGESVRVEIGARDPAAFINAPQLALDALYEMAFNAHPADTEARARHMKLAVQIAELELNKGGN